MSGKFDKKHTVNVSKTLSWLLRHGGLKEGLKFSENGYTDVEELLQNHNMKRLNTTYEDIVNIVENNDKQRFQLLLNKDNHRTYVRATQGHSMVFKDIGYKQVISKDEIGLAVHGTYYKVWPIIQKEGLKTMGRTHIHFAKGLPNDSGVISGMRSNCQILIYLDIKKCLDDEIVIELSDNGVVLTKGVDGVLEPKYFEKVVDYKTGEILM